ncbi:dihydroxyacetone kinase subunit L [Corynebacterium kroppenstedtii]|uniref:Dihydroxyacetone kinase n=1 Tax=Corynebacterium kroppenstedtii (strain DSM 44385 / JCM 11950 / CIP 105744 / CCUG 35717) TaxID=645127 RepID=C4LG95_CORK4|nr:dihydroxyacetone kinase subunit DhaL [Corynebacterium kroppenstedtii]ACR16945.1 Dihydroxyacetone kinase [Corynebacterium kroppenstedtii DSM 44385]QRP09771.1 dihydroxyacetone kinase subunit L [Corynebacterium kroppenstedtii]
MSDLDKAWAERWIRGCAEAASEHREELIDLDRAIGDADHGENVDRGFQAVVKKLDDDQPQDIAGVFKLTAKTLMSTVGGASGPLLGTAFMYAAKAVSGDALDADGVASVVESAVGGVEKRGKATEGEKTMVDAWAPAARAARSAADEGKSPAEVLRAAADAANKGAEATVDMTATKGRASYLGERSVGHKDPGATSSAYFLAEASKAVDA